MSRLHAILTDVARAATHFGAEAGPDVAFDAEVTEGCRGLVVRKGASGRTIRGMDWGFPRLTREMREAGEPPQRLGLGADLTNPMWSTMVPDARYRCLIVLTHFANPDGEAGSKTRTWFSLKDEPIMAWAGFCRNTPEFGPVYAGLTMPANKIVEPTNDRMPVLVPPRDYDQWLRGSVQDVIRFQFGAPPAAARMNVERTEDLWRTGGLPLQRQLL